MSPIECRSRTRRRMPGAAPDRRAWKQVWKRQAINACCRTDIDSAQVVAHRMDLAMRLGACASERALGVSPARTAKAFRPGSRGGVHAHFWMMRFPTRFAVTCQAKKWASALSVQPGSQSSFSASAWTTGVQSATSGTGPGTPDSVGPDDDPCPTPPGSTSVGSAHGRRSEPKTDCGVRGPTGCRGQTLRRRLEVSLSCRPSGALSLWRPKNRSAANAGGCNDQIPE